MYYVLPKIERWSILVVTAVRKTTSKASEVLAALLNTAFTGIIDRQDIQGL